MESLVANILYYTVVHFEESEFDVIKNCEMKLSCTFDSTVVL